MARDFLNRSFENVGIDQKIWFIAENAYGNLASSGLFPTASNACEHTSAKIDYTIPRDNAAHRSGRSVVVRLSGKKSVKWSFESYIVPGVPDMSGNPTLPDTHPLLLNAFGLVDQSDPTQIVYSLARSSTKSFRMLEEGTHFSRLAVGCVCDTVTFTLPGDGKAMLKQEGFGQDLYTAGESTAAALGAAVNAVTVQTGDGKKFEVGGYIDIIDGTDGSTRKASARKITNVTGDVVTFIGSTVTFASGDFVVGAAPDYTPVSSADALLGLNGSFSTVNFGQINAELLSAEIALKNNFDAKTNIYGTDSAQGYYVAKRRDVSVKLDVLLTKDNYNFYVQNKKFIADNLTIVLAPQLIPAPINPTTGRTFTFNFPKVEFNVPAIEQPADSYIKITLEGVALAQDINTPNNEMTLTIS